MTTRPTDADLGRLAVALDALLRDPRCADWAVALRAATPVALRDQLAAAAADNCRHLKAETAVLDGWLTYIEPDSAPAWVTLGAAQTLVAWTAGKAGTCMHSPNPWRPVPVVAAAWRPGLITCSDCTHLFELPRGSTADRRCDGCGHLTTGPEHGDGITPARLGIALMTYMAAVCMTCRWWADTTTRRETQ